MMAVDRMTSKLIPWASPHYWGNEERYVLDAFRSSWISGGAYVERLEADFAGYCGSRNVVSASNGTTALHMAYLALGIGRGDEVIVPGFAFMAAANVAIHVGAIPVFSEVDSETWGMTAADVEKCITPRTKAIVPVHTYGNVCEMDEIMELAKRRQLHVIEDAAEAIGSRYKGKMAGTMAEIGIYSFHATKTITTGEGGAAVSESDELSARMRLYRSHGMSTKRYWHEVAGHNFRLPNMQAAIGCAQLEMVDRITAERARVYASYKSKLVDVDGIRLQKFSDQVDPVVWAIALEIDLKAFPQGRDALVSSMKESGIETRPGFYSASTMPHLYGEQSLPRSDQLSRCVISLPSSPTLTEEEIEQVCQVLVRSRK